MMLLVVGDLILIAIFYVGWRTALNARDTGR